ncbi:MAG: transporter substrate-binding domain-containing protein [Atopobiaceae bacterium]
MSQRCLRRSTFFAIVLAVLFCAVGSALAADAPSAEKRTVRVGYFEFDGYHMLSDDGIRSGYGYEVVEDLARYNNWKIEFVGYDKSWSEMLDMLRDGDIDLLTSARKSPEREAEFDFSDEDIGTSSSMLTVRSGNDSIVAGDYATYDGMRVGMLTSNTRNDDFAGFASEKGFSYAAVPYGSQDDLVAALQSGEVDACLTSSLRSTSNEWVIDEFDPSPFYTTVKKGNDELMGQVNSAISQLDQDSPEWRNTLLRKYYTADAGDELYFTAEERAYLKKLRSDGVVLKVALNPDTAPMSYLDSDGKPAGVLADVFSEIARRAGVDYEVISTPTRADYEAVVESGQADVVADSKSSISYSENQGYTRCDPYLSTTLSQLTLKGTQAVKTVCMTDTVARCIEDQGRSPSDEGLTFVVLDGTQACVDAVASGRYDAALFNTYTARQYMNADDLNRFSVLLLPEYSADVSLAVSSRLDSKLFTVLDKAGHGVTSYATNQLLVQASSEGDGPRSLVGMIYDNPVPFVLAAVAISALVVLIVIMRLRARDARREHALRVSLEENEARLSAALDQATQANEAKSTFLSSMSHDMRTPLNGILGFTGLALGTDDAAARQDYLEKIKLSGDLMLSLVNDTLDLSKIESGKLSLEPKVVDARDLFDAIVGATRISADKRGIDFETDTSQARFGYVRVDPTRLQQIFVNLLSNAIKYTPSGGTVRFAVRRLDEPDEDGCTYVSVVSDTGIGISKEFLPRIYEPFSQEKAAASKDVVGTGLGLSIVRRIVGLMGGRIDVESEQGKGTTFTVRLPIVDADPREAAEPSPAMEERLEGIRVLLVEDNYLNAEIASTLLKGRGAEVVVAADGKEGLEAFEGSKPGDIDVILMDIRMPRMDGYAATKAIRALDRRDAKTVPIIAMSADAYSDDVKHCLEVGMNDHVSKPIDEALLCDAIRREMGEVS